MLAVPPESVAELLELFSAEDVEATVIGEFTGDRRLKLYYECNLVGDLEMGFLHEGRPRAERRAVWTARKPRACWTSRTVGGSPARRRSRTKAKTLARV